MSRSSSDTEPVKVGDQFYTTERYGNRVFIHTVASLTAKQAVMADGMRITLENYTVIGSGNGWDKRWAHRVTDRNREEIRKRVNDYAVKDAAHHLVQMLNSQKAEQLANVFSVEELKAMTERITKAKAKAKQE